VLLQTFILLSFFIFTEDSKSVVNPFLKKSALILATLFAFHDCKGAEANKTSYYI